MQRRTNRSSAWVMAFCPAAKPPVCVSRSTTALVTTRAGGVVARGEPQAAVAAGRDSAAATRIGRVAPVFPRQLQLFAEMLLPSLKPTVAVMNAYVSPRT